MTRGGSGRDCETRRRFALVGQQADCTAGAPKHYIWRELGVNHADGQPATTSVHLYPTLNVKSTVSRILTQNYLTNLGILPPSFTMRAALDWEKVACKCLRRGSGRLVSTRSSVGNANRPTSRACCVQPAKKKGSSLTTTTAMHHDTLRTCEYEPTSVIL